jgi:hypothetical protein
MLMTGSSPKIAYPTAVDSAKSTNVAFNRCFETTTTSDRCSTTGTYQTANVKYDAGSGIVALPGWMSWDQTNQKLVIQPTTTA